MLLAAMLPCLPLVAVPLEQAISTFKKHPVCCDQTMEAVIRADLAQLHQAGQIGISRLFSSAGWTASTLTKDDQAAARAVAAKGGAARQLFSLLCSILKGLSAACSASSSAHDLTCCLTDVVAVMHVARRAAESPLWLLTLARCCSLVGKITGKLCSEQQLVPSHFQGQQFIVIPAALLLGPGKFALTAADTCVGLLGANLAAAQLAGEGAAAAAAMQALQARQAALSALLQQRFSMHAPAQQPKDFQQDIRDAVGPELPLQLQQLGDAVSTQLPTDLACNNPGCCNGAQLSEQDLANGCSCRCSGCKVAR